jgi:hypothetical protein
MKLESEKEKEPEEAEFAIGRENESIESGMNHFRDISASLFNCSAAFCYSE